MKIPKPTHEDGHYYYSFPNDVNIIISRVWQDPKLWTIEVFPKVGPYMCETHSTKKACESAIPRLFRALPVGDEA